MITNILFFIISIKFRNNIEYFFSDGTTGCSAVYDAWNYNKH